MEFIEQNCIFEHEGRIFESGGAYALNDCALAYLCLPDGEHPYARGTVTDWHGNHLGACIVTSRWRNPRGRLSTHTLQVEVTIDGRVYTGRSAGHDMVWKGKVKKS